MRNLFFFSCILTVATPTIAQDGSEGGASRTPESANRFLYQLFSQEDAGDVSYDVRSNAGAIVHDDFIGGEAQTVAGDLGGLTFAGPCKSKLQLRDAQIAVTGGNKLPGFERIIDWSKVSKVDKTNVTKTETTLGADGKPAGQRVMALHGLRITMRNGWQKLAWSTPSEEERDRALFAVEFLRQGCAIASDTGF